MQERLYGHHPLCQESTPLHHNESAPNDFPSFIDSGIAPMSVGASVPTQFCTWCHYPLTPTFFSSTALNFDRAPNAAVQGALSLPLTDRDYAVDAYPRPWYAPQTALEERNAAVIQFDGGQAPSETIDLSLFEQRPTQPTDGHAVEAPTQIQTQPTSYPTLPWLSVQPVGPLDMRTNPISQISQAQAHYQGQAQAHATIAGLDLMSYQMTDPVLEQAPPSPRIIVNARRRRHRGAHTRPEHVVCDQCKKLMCRQSLRRHIREVHHNVKRSYSKSAIAAAGFTDQRRPHAEDVRTAHLFL